MKAGKYGENKTFDLIRKNPSDHDRTFRCHRRGHIDIVRHDDVKTQFYAGLPDPFSGLDLLAAVGSFLICFKIIVTGFQADVDSGQTSCGQMF